MSWGGFADAVGLACLFVGALSCLTSAVGLLRLSGPYSRMHAATKPQALGVVLVLLGVGLRLRSGSETGMLVLAACFQLVTIPVASHLLAQAYHRTGGDPPEGSSSFVDPPPTSAGPPPRA